MKAMPLVLVAFVLSLLLFANGLTPEEVKIRNELNVPLDAPHVLILSQASHLDWDWLNYFSTNVNDTPTDEAGYWNENPIESPQPVDSIFTAATQLLRNHPDYYYSICETAFLRGFANTRPDMFEELKKCLPRLRSVGGGMTSPDNLLPHGETLLRNYLVGVNWLQSQGIEWSSQAWFPDDFGHDSQLPVLLQAMGVQGIGFARIPGACDQNQNWINSTSAVLLDRRTGGVDFTWAADDGSSVFAHWLESHYDQGQYIYKEDDRIFGTPEQVAQCSQQFPADGPIGHIAGYIGANQPVSPTPYIYVHVSEDFALPQLLVDAAQEWNAEQYNSSGVYVVVATFDHYVKMATAYASANPGTLKTRNFHGKSPLTSFASSPYWMGFYASRPELKNLHNKITRNLVAAEALSVTAKQLLKNSPVTQADIDEVWMHFVPSTHHDFITGTSTDYVYNGEQLPRLRDSLTRAETLRNSSMQLIANNVPPAPNNDAPNLIVFNSNGFDAQGIVSIPNSAHMYEQYPHLHPLTQPTADGSTLVYVDAPSMGYKQHSSSQSMKALFDAHIAAHATATTSPTADSFTMENSFLKAVISKSDNWSLTALYDKSNGNSNVLAATTPGNTINFFYDGGNIYRFGFEQSQCLFGYVSDWTVTPLNATLVENGPLRIRLVTTVKFQSSTWEGYHNTNVFTIQYILHANEPFLRISTTGAAPPRTSVVVTFPFAQSIASFEHGTPYHWTTKTPQRYGNNRDFHNSFEAVHDFVIGHNASGQAVGAIYHTGSMPAWAVDDAGRLVGVLLRNTPGTGCAGFGADGSDSDVHTQEYAIRVPGGLSAAKTGQPLLEARRFNTPLVPVLSSSSPVTLLPPSFSLASVSAGTGIITAAKTSSTDNGQLILRVYQPTNMPAPLILSVRSSSTTATAKYVSALERPLNNSTLPISTRVALKPQDPALVKIQAAYALTTIAIANN